jgi:Secretion system C-terminal sorting domain
MMRNYLIGGSLPNGSELNVKEFSWGNGDSLGSEADLINPKYMFSGNPVIRDGWLNITENDWKFLNSTGPFQLEKGKPIELIYAYIVGRGDSPLNSVTIAKEYALEIHKFYKSNFTQLPVDVKMKKNNPRQFSLSQNYPNPFNPSTTIKYKVPSTVKGETSNVKLVVFDVLGREVATLVNQEQQAGNYEVEFDASGISSGTYFYRITSGEFSASKKMILLR